MSLISVYKYLPYMKVYDDTESVWSPYLMLKQKNLINNNVFNTDKFGFRYTDSFKKFTILDDIEKNENDEQIAVIGNSTAFGVGASSDKKTISSYLTNFSKKRVYNLALRTCNSFQELILFLQVLNKFNNLKTVVIVSGFNDVLIDKYVENKPLLNPPLFYQNRINEMNKNLTNSFFKNLFHKISFKNLNKKKSTFEIDKEFDWKENFSKNLKVWSSISKEFNFKIIFALQPYYKWSKNLFTTEETAIFNEIEEKKIRTYQVLKNFNQEEYLKTDRYFKKVCEKNNIFYIDLNKILKSHDTSNNWLFVDALHLTDLGYKIVSEKINLLIK